MQISLSTESSLRELSLWSDHTDFDTTTFICLHMSQSDRVQPETNKQNPYIQH